MRESVRRAIIATGGLLIGFSAAVGQDVEAGKIVYDKWCVECHGIDGLGDGSAATAMLPRPRDFSQARYQIRTTGSGQLPTDDDLKLVIQEGLPGTTMPGWPNLSNSETNDVIAYVKSLSRFFGQGDPPRALDFGSDPGGGLDAVEAGAQAYLALECEACHGASGRGEGTSAPTLEDWRGFPVRAADLTEGWYLNGGGSVEDIHTRVLTGLDGTPMPAASDAMDAGVVSPDEVWQLAHYIADLGSAEMPTLRDVVRVTRVEGSLPTDGSEAGWEGVDTFYFPLAGQVIQPPRNFAPTVDGVYVQGLHDGADIALRVQWNDPSQSPDPAWDEWQVKFMNAIDLDGDSLVVDDREAPVIRPPDALTVQFPFEVPEGTEKPYFLMGDARNPVYLWTWNGELGVRAARGRGLDSVEELDEDPVTGSATWDAGRWTLYLRRAVSMEGDGLSFEEGTVIPIAFLAWDGSSGEVGKRSSISSWYYILLDKPASSTVVVTPLIAILLTGALGLVLVRRAQDRDRG